MGLLKGMAYQSPPSMLEKSEHFIFHFLWQPCFRTSCFQTHVAILLQETIEALKDRKDKLKLQLGASEKELVKAKDELKYANYSN